MAPNGKSSPNSNERELSSPPPVRISPGYVFLLICSPALVAPLYCFVGRLVAQSHLSCFDYLALVSLLGITFVGGFQIFFWIQNNNYRFKTRCLKIWLDDLIPFWPRWIWVYSGLFYILVGLVAVSIPTIEQGVYVIFGGLVLLLVQSLFFFAFPCTVPPSWREYELTNLSRRFLRFNQDLDNGRNCFPSMHCSVAMYAALIMLPTLSYYALLVVLVTSLSGLFVKQHQILDIPAGIALGMGVHALVF